MKHSIVALFLLLAISITAQDFGNFKTKIGNQVPNFEFTSIDGVKMTNKDLEGKVVLLNFWATWCGPCIKEMPSLNKFAKTQDPEKFVVVALARGQDESAIQGFIDNNGYDFVFAADMDKAVYTKFAEKSIPRNVVLNAQGKIIYQLMGYYPEKMIEMEKLIEREISKLPK